ncbi:MAG: hypothetical protein HWN68_10935 [Desulfobacterales bacterium]|nr:hypothetical protein [Desulfobacterales bacterium]
MILTPVIAMLCITGLEVVALTNGINGAIFGVAIAAIAGLGGYEIKVLRDKKRGGK